MGKSLIKIRTRVHVQLRLTNHCLRPLSIRILKMGPQLQGRVLTAVPPGPLGATSGQRHQLEHLQGNLYLSCCTTEPILPQHQPRPPRPQPRLRALMKGRVNVAAVVTEDAFSEIMQLAENGDTWKLLREVTQLKYCTFPPRESLDF